jgi:peptidoglycan/LPS O-acetylase OafA/YrhL
LCIGLVIALIEVINVEFLKKIKWIGFIVFITYLCFGNKPLENNYIMVHFLFSAIACGGILIFCYSFSNASKLPTLIIEFLSKISYSVYLVHLPLLHRFNYYFLNDYGNKPFIYLISYLFLVTLFSFLNYKYFESYFLKLRKS